MSFTRNRIVRSGTRGDQYLDRVAKYVPVEIVAAWLALFTLFEPQGVRRASVELASVAPLEPWQWLTIFFFVLWTLTPIYIWRVKRPGDRWITHAGISAAAFPLWVYAMRGPLVEHYERVWDLPPFLANALLILFTLIAALFEPPPPDEPQL
jgi:hypothetical protein